MPHASPPGVGLRVQTPCRRLRAKVTGRGCKHVGERRVEISGSLYLKFQNRGKRSEVGDVMTRQETFLRVPTYPQRKVLILLNFKFRGGIAQLNHCLTTRNPTKRTAFSYQLDGYIPTKRTAFSYQLDGIADVIDSARHRSIWNNVSYQTDGLQLWYP
jgi:hypothetical protein